MHLLVDGREIEEYVIPHVHQASLRLRHNGVDQYGAYCYEMDQYLRIGSYIRSWVSNVAKLRP